MNSIIPRPEAAPSVYNPDDFGNLPRPPSPIRCTVGQPTSQKGEVGKFNFSKPDWAPTDKMVGVTVLAPRATRVLFGKTFQSASRCGSDNYQTPAPRYSNPVWGNCLECPAALWPNQLVTKEQMEKRDELIKELEPKRLNIPLCTEMVNLMMIDDRLTPFLMQFSKTQLKNVYDNLINVFRYSGKRIFSQSFDIGLKKISSASGTYFECVFSNFRDVDDVKKFEDMHKFWSAMAERTIGEQHAQMDAEKEVAEVGNG